MQLKIQKKIQNPEGEPFVSIFEFLEQKIYCPNSELGQNQPPESDSYPGPPRGGAEGVTVRGPGDTGGPGVLNCQV